MKKNLIKILAISTLVFGLGACNLGNNSKSEGSSQQSSQQQSSESETHSSESQSSESQSSESQSSESQSSESSSSEEEAQEVTITEILDLNAQGKWALEGKKVVVKGLAVAAFYGNTLIGTTALGTTVNTLRAVQIDYDEIDDLPEGARNIFAAEITAEGVLQDEEGHPVITHAKVSITNARRYDENNQRIDGTGASVYYWNNFSRAGFGSYVGRALSFPTRGVYQLASLPGEVTTDAASTFEVVFPGENLDTENLDNDALITCYIPAGLSAGQAAAINAFFEGKQAGDGVDMFAITYFNYSVCGGAGFLIDSYWAEFAAAELDIQYTWAEAVEKVQDYFIDPIPNMGYDEKAISYLVDFDPTNAPDDVLLEDYIFVDPSLWGRTNTATFTINFAAEEDTVAACASINSNLEAAGWQSQLEEDTAAGYVLVENEKVVAQALYEFSDTQITIYYMAHDESVGYDTAAEVLALYQNGVNAVATALELEKSLTTAIDLTTTAEAVSAGYVVDLSGLTANIQYFDDYGLFADAAITIEFANEDDAEASAVEIYENLLDAGFVDGFYNDWVQYTGMWNATTSEFVTVSADDEYVVLSIEYLDVADILLGDFIMEADAESAYAQYAGYANYYMNYYSSYGFYTGGIALTAFNFGEGVDPVYTDIDFSSLFDIANATQGTYFIMDFMFSFEFADEDTALAAIMAYDAALEAAGFVWAESALFNAAGLWNATTGEFVYLGLDENVVYVEVLVHELGLSDTITLEDDGE